MADMNIIITISTLAGAGLGSFVTHALSKFSKRIQKLECYFTNEDILSKIPQKNDDDTIYNNIYCKTFKLKNTTNIDIKSMEVLFQFDSTSQIIECYSKSKDGFDKQKIKPSKKYQNEAHAYIELFNRNDEIEFFFKIANITTNTYYIVESKCLGIKVVCKDKCNKKSNLSSDLLISK